MSFWMTWICPALAFFTLQQPDWFDLGIDGPYDSPPFTLEPDVAWANPLFAKSGHQFASCAHSITIFATQLPYDFEDSTVAFHAMTVPLCDIKPGSDPNSINLNSNGVVPIALLGSAEVNIGDVNVATLEFHDTSPVHDLSDPLVYTGHLEDVNLDGYMDLVSHYRAKDSDISHGWTEASINGDINGFTFVCTDDIIIRGKPE
jgi:hypothetical protein